MQQLGLVNPEEFGLPAVGTDEWYDRCDRILAELEDKLVKAKSALDATHPHPRRLMVVSGRMPRWEDCTEDQARAYALESALRHLADLIAAVFLPMPGEDPWDKGQPYEAAAIALMDARAAAEAVNA